MMNVKDVLIDIVLYLSGSSIFCLLDGIACRLACGKKVGKNQSLFLSLMGGILAILCVRKYGYSPAALIVFVLLGVLVMISQIDFNTMEIPDRLNLMILILGIISAFTIGGISWQSRLIGFFCVSLPMMVLSILAGGGFGGGDIKLMAASGVFLGWKLNMTAALIGFFLGGLYGAWLLIAKKAGRKDYFAFGPFLCIGIAAALFIGDADFLFYS